MWRAPPGTGVDVRLTRDGLDYVFVDTAGVRRRTKITDSVERYSVNAAIKSGSKAHVTLLTLDATEGVSQQDKRLMDMLNTRKIPFMVVINKCDLVPRASLEQLKKNVGQALSFCPHVPLLTVSALKGLGLGKILPLARKIHEECSVRIPTGQINRAMEAVLTRHQPRWSNACGPSSSTSPRRKQSRPPLSFLSATPNACPKVTCATWNAACGDVQASPTRPCVCTCAPATKKAAIKASAAQQSMSRIDSTPAMGQ